MTPMGNAGWNREQNYSNPNIAKRELTFGEKAVGLTFNPSNDPDVQQIKQAFAAAIDLCNNIRATSAPGEKGRLLSLAITKAQAAEMWAVKGVTWTY